MTIPEKLYETVKDLPEPIIAATAICSSLELLTLNKGLLTITQSVTELAIMP